MKKNLKGLFIIPLALLLFACGKKQEKSTTKDNVKTSEVITTNNNTIKTTTKKEDEFSVSFVLDNQKIEKGGKISKPNDPIRDGYTFSGWYYKDKKWSFTDDVVNDNMILTPKWIANTNTAYKVEHCLQNLDDAYSLFETENLTGTTDTLTNASTNVYEGFTAPSITQVNINGDGSTIVVLSYIRNSYIVELKKNIDEAGTITGDGSYKYGREITIKAQANSGYIFDGWYIDSEKTEYSQEQTFIMPSKKITLEARFIENPFNYDSNNSTKITGLKNKSLTNLVIPNGVTEIGNEAFSGCSNIISISIPSSVQKIGNRAFYGCTSLKSIEIPNGVKSIESGTFYNCEKLTSVVIPNSVTAIWGYAFCSCTSLTGIEIPNSVTNIESNAFAYCSNLVSIEIPDYVSSISEGLFARCKKLESIVLPASLTSIGNRAFEDCTSLSKVYFKGTLSQWYNITIGSNNNYLNSDKVYYYSENYSGSNSWHYDSNGNPTTIWE